MTVEKDGDPEVLRSSSYSTTEQRAEGQDDKEEKRVGYDKIGLDRIGQERTGEDRIKILKIRRRKRIGIMTRK